MKSVTPISLAAALWLGQTSLPAVQPVWGINSAWPALRVNQDGNHNKTAQAENNLWHRAQAKVDDNNWNLHRLTLLQPGSVSFSVQPGSTLALGLNAHGSADTLADLDFAINITSTTTRGDTTTRATATQAGTALHSAVVISLGTVLTIERLNNGSMDFFKPPLAKLAACWRDRRPQHTAPWTSRPSSSPKTAKSPPARSITTTATLMPSLTHGSNPSLAASKPAHKGTLIAMAAATSMSSRTALIPKTHATLPKPSAGPTRSTPSGRQRTQLNPSQQQRRRPALGSSLQRLRQRRWTGGMELLDNTNRQTAKRLLLTDHLGSTRDAVDGTTGTTTTSLSYSPWGKRSRIQGQGTETLSQGYTGHLSHESGLSLAVYRPCDPETARWPSRDPIGERGGINLYGMGGNDPVNHTDYLGLQPALPPGWHGPGTDYDPSANLFDNSDGSWDCPMQCILKHVLGITVSSAAVAIGQPLVPKRFVTPGPAEGTGIVGKMTDAVLGNLKTPRSRTIVGCCKVRYTKSASRFGSRWIPIIGWVQLSVDAATASMCVCEECGNK